MNKKQLGAEGERFVSSQLQHQNFIIIETNWRCRFGEIDIVARKDGELYIIEVRTRTIYEGKVPRFGYAIEAIHPSKIRKLHYLAQLYCYTNQENNYRYHLLFAPVTYYADTTSFKLEQLISI